MNKSPNKIFYTYMYLDPSRDDEIFYVGKGCGERKTDHLIRKDKHPFTHRLNKMKRNNISPDIKLLAENINEPTAFFLEISAIHLIGRKSLKSGPLLNLSNGGDGSSGFTFKHTEESKKKMSEAAKGRVCSEESRKKMSLARKGKKQSEQHIKNCADAHRGKKMSDKARQSMSRGSKGRLHGPMSDEQKQMLSLAQKGRKKTPEQIAKSVEGKRLAREKRLSLLT